MIMNYNYLKKEKFDSIEDLRILEPYDCLISSYVEVDRVREPSQKIPCNELWWVCADKAQCKGMNGNRVFCIAEDSDGGIAKSLMEAKYKKICIDMTGFIIPELLLLLRILHINGFHSIDVIYTEPNQYKRNEDTQFSDTLLEVKQIFGYAGLHISDMTNDLLVIAAGYDHSRSVDVANAKKSANNKVLLFGFPPLSPGMFQENILRAYQAESAVGSDCFKNLEMNIFAPANDPFSTAQALKEFMDHPRKKTFTNVYFSPLSSKPQALGMALFYIWENGWEKEWSIIYPFCCKYNNDTSQGISKIWRYKVELP